MHQLREESGADQRACLNPAVFEGKVAELLRRADEDLVGLEEMGNQILRRMRFHLHLRDRRQRRQVLETSGRDDIQRAQALGKFVDGEEEFLVLGLENRVQAEKRRPLHVPVGELRLA